MYDYFKLSLDHFPKTNAEAGHMSKVPYVDFIGGLMYDMVFIRPYLAQIISQVFKFMSKPSKCHCEAFNWIFVHLKDTIGHGIMLSSGHGDLQIVEYVDSHYAGDINDRRSTT